MSRAPGSTRATPAHGPMQHAATLPPLRAQSASAGIISHMPQPGLVGSAAEVALAFDFEMRATVAAPVGGAGGLASSMGGGRAMPRKLASSASAATLGRDPSAMRATTPLNSFTSGSLAPLPSHCLTTADKLHHYLSWNKGATVGDADDSGGGIAGVLTPRTRYERLAQSVAAVPFAERSAVASPAIHSEESKEQRPSRHVSGRTLSSSVSSPALLHSHSASSLPRGLLSSPSHNSLRHAALLHCSSSSSSFVPPSQFLATYMPTAAMASPTLEENERARAVEINYARAVGQRKQRKKLAQLGKPKKVVPSGGSKHVPHSSDGDASNLLAANDGSSGLESSSDGMELDMDALLGGNGGPRRKPGTHTGQALMHQIQAVIRAVSEEKAEQMAHAASSGKAGGAGEKKKHVPVYTSSDDDDAPVARREQNAKPLTIEERNAAQEAEQLMLQSTIQNYMEQTGLAGSVAAGGSSAAALGVTGGSAGSGVIKDREGNTTFTQARMTRDVKLVLAYLQSNPVMKAELFDRIKARQEHKRRKARRRAAREGKLGAINKVEANKLGAWSLTEEAREANRQEVARQEQIRVAQQQERKAAIDAIWQRRAAERDAAIMLRFGPEMEARRRRENAENDRLQRVQWGWLMFTQLIPITVRLQWKLKAIVQERLQRQVRSFLVPLLRRNYVLNITSKLNENRALALAKIKRVLVRYVTRWKWRKRRAAMLHLWKFLTLVKNAHQIRAGLKDSSLRSQIVKIQSWWRGLLYGVVEGQISLVELKWNRRENELVHAWAKKQKREAALQAKNEAQQGNKNQHRPKRPLPAHLVGGHRSFPKSNSRRNLSSTGDFTSTLDKFNFNASPSDHDASSSSSSGLAPKRLPKAQKREVIARYVRKKRSAFRAALRTHKHDVSRWNEEHKHEIELHKARRELGLKQLGHHAAAVQAPVTQLVPPPRPFMRMLPSQHELDHIIMAASKQYVLGKLRGATMASSSSTNGGGGGGGGGGDDTGSNSAASTTRFQDGGAPASSAVSLRRGPPAASSSSSASSSPGLRSPADTTRAKQPHTVEEEEEENFSQDDME